MRSFAGSGGVRPSRAMSLMTVAVGLGMLLAVAGFLVGGPLLGAVVFFGVWVATVLAIIGYHLWNALSPRGVDHTQFHFRADHEHEGANVPKHPPGS